MSEPGEYSEETLARLVQAALALLPPGWAFTRRLDGTIATVLEALSVELARWHSEVQVLRSQVSPRRGARADYVAAWEEAAGIATSGTLAERAAQVAEKIKGRRSHAFAAYAAAAAAHGFSLVDVVPAESVPFEVDVSDVGSPLSGDAWAYAFTARVSWGDSEDVPALEAAIREIKRAHTIVRVEEVVPEA